jgi:hypothetical protein
MIEKLLHDLLAVDFFGFGFVGGDDSVSEHIAPYRFYVFGRYVTASLNKGMGARRPR